MIRFLATMGLAYVGIYVAILVAAALFTAIGVTLSAIIEGVQSLVGGE